MAGGGLGGAAGGDALAGAAGGGALAGAETVAAEPASTPEVIQLRSSSSVSIPISPNLHAADKSLARDEAGIDEGRHLGAAKSERHRGRAGGR